MTTTTDIIEDARGYATKAVEDASGALDDAVRAIEDAPVFYPSRFSYSPEPIELLDVDGLEDFNLAGFTNHGTIPNIPEFITFTPEVITIGDTPILDFTVREIERPVFDIGSFDEVPPETPVIDLPPDPDIIIKAAPPVRDIDLGDLPDVIPPEFSAEFNEVAPEYTDNLKDEYITEYERALPAIQNFVDGQMDSWVTKFAPNYHANRAQLEAKIAEDMADGRAMPDEYEVALRNRAKATVERERDRMEQDLDLSHGKRGFVLPAGSLSAGRNKIHMASANNIAQQSTELVVRISELEIQHKQFVMQLSMGLHQHVQSMALQYAGVLVSINGQALDSARQVAAVVAQQYELLLTRYREIAAVYAIEASVFKVQLEAALANVEIYKVRAEAAKVSVEVDALKIEAYVKELDFELAKVDIFRAKLQGIESRLSLAKLDVDIYGTKADAYLTLVKGKEAEFNAYSAAVRGEESRVKVEVLKVDGYKAEVDAALAKSNVDKVRAQIIADINAANVSVFDAGVKAHNALVDVEGTRIQSESVVYRAKADGFRSKADVQAAKASIHNKGEDLKASNVHATWQVNSSENIAAGKIALQRSTSIAQIGIAAGGSWAGIAESALSSQNTMISESKQIQS